MNYKNILILPEHLQNASDVTRIGRKHKSKHFTYVWWHVNGSELIKPLYFGKSPLDKEWKKGTYFSRLYRELGGTPGFGWIAESTGSQQHYKKWVERVPELTKNDVAIFVYDYTNHVKDWTDKQIDIFISNREHDLNKNLTSTYGFPTLNIAPTKHQCGEPSKDFEDRLNSIIEFK